jgi:hypothetical protein
MPDLSPAAAGCMMDAPFGWRIFFGFRYTNLSKNETRVLSEISDEPVSGCESSNCSAWVETEGWKWFSSGV